MKLFDNYLQLIVEKLPSYDKDVPDFIKKIRGVQENTFNPIVVTMGV